MIQTDVRSYETGYLANDSRCGSEVMPRSASIADLSIDVKASEGVGLAAVGSEGPHTKKLPHLIIKVYTSVINNEYRY